jgi:hypothetical protein
LFVKDRFPLNPGSVKDRFHCITVLWNQGIQTDREVLTNRPDIIVKNKKDKNLLID